MLTTHLFLNPPEFGPLLHYFILFAWLIYAFETYLDIRQHATFSVKTKPKELTYITQEEFEKMQKYGADKSRFGFISTLWSTLKLTAWLYLGVYPLLWNYSGSLLTHFGFDAKAVYIQTAIFYILDATIDTLMGLPFSAYKTFVIEERHGFNKQTGSLFLTDTVKGLALNCLIGPPLIILFVYVIDIGGQYFYIYVGALLLIVQLLAVPIYANFIQPCFNVVSTLPAGPLRTSIEELASSIKFPLTELYVIDGSKRSSHSNAYFYGFFKSKRIVLFDTLLSQCTEPQVLSVLGHELGHWSLNHTVKNLIVGQVQMVVMFYMFGLVLHHPSLYTDFGFHNSQPTYIGLLLFSFMYSPVQHVTSFLMNMLSRKFEFEADEFAVKLGHGSELIQALITLQKENKGTPISDEIYSAYHHSHPPLLQRIQAIEKKVKVEGKKAK